MVCQRAMPLALGLPRLLRVPMAKARVFQRLGACLASPYGRLGSPQLHHKMAQPSAESAEVIGPDRYSKDNALPGSLLAKPARGRGLLSSVDNALTQAPSLCLLAQHRA